MCENSKGCGLCTVNSISCKWTPIYTCTCSYRDLKANRQKENLLDAHIHFYFTAKILRWFVMKKRQEGIMIAFEVFRICDKKNICETLRHKCRLHPVKLIIFQNFNPFAKLYTRLLNLNRKFQTHLKVFKLKINFCGLLHHISLLHFCKKRVLMTFFIPTYFFKSQSTLFWRIRCIRSFSNKMRTFCSIF